MRWVVTIAAIASLQTFSVWPASEATSRVFFEGIDCSDGAFQIYVRALAAAQQLGYEIRDSSTTQRRFEGRLKDEGRRIELSVKVTCSVVAHSGFEAFYGPPGVAVSVAVRPRRGGRAVASQEAARFEAQLRRTARAVQDQSPEACLGISVRDAASLEPEVRSRLGTQSGALIAEVHTPGPGAAAGLEPWDVVMGIDGVAMTDGRSPIRFLGSREPGDEVALLLIRDGETRRVAVTLGRRTDDGACTVAGAARPSAPPEPIAVPSLTVQAAEVIPQVVPSGSPFDVRVVIVLSLPSPTDPVQEVTVDIEILRDGEVLYRPSATTASCRDGAPTTVVRHLRAGREAGGYQLRVSATDGSLSDRRSVPFEIR